MMAFSETADVIFMLCGKAGQMINGGLAGISNAMVPSICGPSTGNACIGFETALCPSRTLKSCTMPRLKCMRADNAVVIAGSKPRSATHTRST
jgi:hypothetical protein